MGTVLCSQFNLFLYKNVLIMTPMVMIWEWTTLICLNLEQSYGGAHSLSILFLHTSCPFFFFVRFTVLATVAIFQSNFGRSCGGFHILVFPWGASECCPSGPTKGSGTSTLVGGKGNRINRWEPPWQFLSEAKCYLLLLFLLLKIMMSQLQSQVEFEWKR